MAVGGSKFCVPIQVTQPSAKQQQVLVVAPDDVSDFEQTDGVLGYILYNRHTGFYIEATQNGENSRHGLKVLMKNKK